VNRESIPGLGAGAEAPRAASRALDTPCAWLAGGLPLVVGLASASAEPGWHDDVGILRDLGFVRLGFDGAPSTLVAQLLALLPIGGRFLRLSLVGVLALALASRLLFEGVRALLDRRGSAPIHPLLALLASSLWALGPAVLGEATHAGGALLAIALVLLVLRLIPDAFEAGDTRALVGAGLAAGAALAESHAAGACALLVLGGAALVWRERSWPRHAGRLVSSVAFSFALLSSLRWVVPAWASQLPAPEVGATSAAPPHVGAVTALLRAGEAFVDACTDLGGVPLVLAGVGLALAAGRGAQSRRALAPWLLLAATGFGAAHALPSPAAVAFGALVPSLALTAPFALGLGQAVKALWAARLPFGRPAAVLAVVFASTLVLSRLDRALLARPAPAGVEAWTRAALGGLPDETLLLVHTPALARRLLAARVLSGTRPDVVLVPSPFITAGSIGRELLRSDPSSSPLLRQLWVNGSADEYSLSRLADERPVRVELDRSWDRRLLEHLRPDGLWFGFSAPALGASEQQEAAVQVGAALRGILELSGGDGALDPASRRALGDAIGAQALAFARLDRDEPARRLLSAALRIDRNSPLVREARLVLAEGERGRVAASGRME
jgi:hypothetical protein